MGYTTDFNGQFTLNKKLDDETYDLLIGLNETRRMKRNVDPKYGCDGEFYVENRNNFGQDREGNIVDYNTPPRTQPGLWCQWRPTEDRLQLEWDQGEKFYGYVEWIVYLIDKILAPRGYVLNGIVNWSGEEMGDIGSIIVEENKVRTVEGEYLNE